MNRQHQYRIMTGFRGSRLILATLTCILALILQPTHVFAASPELSVIPSGDKWYDMALQTFAESAEQEINLLLVSHTTKPPIVFHTSPLPTQFSGSSTQFIDRKKHSQEQAVTIIHSLIRRRVHRSQADAIPPWLIAGIFHRTKNRVESQFPEDSLRASRHLVRAGHTVSLKALMQTKAPGPASHVYTVYADMCATLLHIFHKQSITALSYILNSNHPIPRKTLKTILKINPADLEAWFAQQFNAVAQPHRLTPDETVAKLESLFRSHLFSGNKKDSVETLLITTDPGQISAPSRREFLTQCYRLRVKCPTLMSNAFDQLIVAATHLHAGKPREFQKRMPVVWGILLKRRDYTKALASYLRDHSIREHEALSHIVTYHKREISPSKFFRRLNQFLHPDSVTLTD